MKSSQRASLWLATSTVVLAGLWPLQAHALFGDDEARKAIIELRQDFNATKEQFLQTTQDNANMRRSMLDLSGQLEQLRGEMAQLRGQNEELQRQLNELKQQQEQARVQQPPASTAPAGPQGQGGAVVLDGREFEATPDEQRDYSVGLDLIRKSEFDRAEMAFSSFLRVYPNSGYTPSVLYWLGNAQFANRAYREAVGTHRRLINTYPDHPRAPEAMLASANSLLELKEKSTAKQTLQDLVKRYPDAEAAGVAKERLQSMR
ncbi:tol-pal system protein YbgF [Hydrogenophaga sp. 5NK40-0174]|uniref:tol-pal system protein YbgF n=1 Tax=Hydrogenophaga sp. 5NK40-0174 TaxID=3127649 RepID=UPI0033411A48